MFPLLLPLAVALAAPTVRVAGVTGGRAVAVVLERGGEVTGATCNDAGVAPDEAVDGVLSCGPLPPVSGAVRVGLLRDGRLVDAGDTTLDGDVALRVDGGTVVLGDASLLRGARAGAALRPLPTVFARVRVAEGGSAPVVRLQSTGGSAELVCRDDGVFPDADRNDGEHGCAGPASGDRAEVFLNGGGSGSSLGSVVLDPARPFAFLVVDAAARKVRVETFPIAGFAPESAAAPPPDLPAAPPEEPAPPAEAPPAEAPPAEAAPAAAPARAAAPAAESKSAEAQKPPGNVETPNHSPVASRSLGNVPPLALFVAVGLGAAGAFGWRRRAGRLPTTLRPHPTPPVLPGGPALTEPAAALRTSDPAGLAAALLPRLARHRRVVVVSVPYLLLPEIADGPVYRASSGDCEEIEAAVRALARAPGAPVAVMVVDNVLTEVGAVAPSPARKLRDGLPVGVSLLLLSAEGHAGVPAWDVVGPDWHAAPAA